MIIPLGISFGRRPRWTGRDAFRVPTGWPHLFVLKLRMLIIYLADLTKLYYSQMVDRAEESMDLKTAEVVSGGGTSMSDSPVICAVLHKWTSNCITVLGWGWLPSSASTHSVQDFAYDVLSGPDLQAPPQLLRTRTNMGMGMGIRRLPANWTGISWRLGGWETLLLLAATPVSLLQLHKDSNLSRLPPLCWPLDVHGNFTLTDFTGRDSELHCRLTGRK